MKRGSCRDEAVKVEVDIEGATMDTIKEIVVIFA